MSHLMTDGRLCGLPDDHKGHHRSLESIQKHRDTQREHVRERYRNDVDFRETQRLRCREDYRVHRKRRLERKYTPEYRERERELSRIRARNNSFNYAIFYPSAQLLKIGSQSFIDAALKLASNTLLKRKIESSDGYIIWQEPISYLKKHINEKRLQTEIGYFLAHREGISRCSAPEWFRTENYGAEDLILLIKTCQLHIHSWEETSVIRLQTIIERG